MLRSLFAIFAALVTALVLFILSSALLIERSVVGTLIAWSLCGVAGGWVAAVLAPRRLVTHSVCFSLVASAAMTALGGDAPGVSAASMISSVAATLATAASGGILRRHQVARATSVFT